MNKRHLPRTVRSAAVLTVALLVGALLSAPAGADTTNDLAAAKKRLNRLIDRISVTEDAAAVLQSEANAIAAQVDAVQSQIARVQAQIVGVQGDIVKAQKKLVKTQDQLDHRAWVAYENGPGFTLEVVLGADSLADLSDRLAIVNAAARSDRDLIELIQALEANLHLREEKLTSLQSGLRSQQADLVGKEKSLQSKLDSEQQILDQLSADKAEAAGLVRRLQKKRAAEVAALKRALAAAAAQGSSSHGPSIGGVFQVCPVDPHAYSDDFGAPRYSGGFHPHAGNDIFAGLGTPIHATFSGNAVIASNGLGGLSVKVYGSLGYTYNAHLSKFGNLGAVSAGDVIGYVGNSGDAAGGPYHDHFEWHPNSIPSPLWKSPYGYSQIGSAIDPYPYLNSVCG